MSDTRKLAVLLYGRAKSGKTTLADSAPGPRLLLDAEMGSDFLDSDQRIWDIESGQECPTDLDEDSTVVVYIREYATLNKVFEFLDEGTHPFETVILDSLTEIQQRYMDDNVGTDQMKIQQWGELKRKISLAIRGLRDLKAHSKKPLNVIFIAALDEVHSENGEVRQTILMSGSVGKEIPYVVDITALLYLDKENNGARTLFVGSHTLSDTGDRTGYLPEKIVDPDFLEILNVIEAGAKKAKAARKEKRARLVSNK